MTPHGYVSTAALMAIFFSKPSAWVEDRAVEAFYRADIGSLLIAKPMSAIHVPFQFFVDRDRAGRV